MTPKQLVVCTLIWSLLTQTNSQILGASDTQYTATKRESSTLRTSSPEDTAVKTNQVFDLTASEWSRVEQLNDGIRQYLSVHNLSPIEVLGIHARTSAERAKYARQWAQVVLADTERVLQFQRAYDEAIKELTRGLDLVDVAQLPSRQSELPKLLPSDRLALFVALDCASCTSLVNKSMKSLHRVAGLDIYLLGKDRNLEQKLHQWARQQGIPPSAVQHRKITLNLDDGLLERIHPRSGSIPILMVRRDDQFDPIHVSHLLQM